MKKLINIYANWRIDCLFLLFSITLILVISEADSLQTLILAKITGIVTGTVFYYLYKRWSKAGLINELTQEELLK